MATKTEKIEKGEKAEKAERIFTGPEKAAILLMLLGEEVAAAVLANLEEREIQVMGNYMAALGDVDDQVMDQIIKEFYEIVESGG